MSAYTIYLDKEETFECEVSIKNASIKDSSVRLIIESDDINLVFFGTISKDTISVPIRSLKKYFTESDKATIKLEVIVENNLVTPWQSELLFDSYNKVEIKEKRAYEHEQRCKKFPSTPRYRLPNLRVKFLCILFSYRPPFHAWF